jgi:hypothetical protein
MKQKSLVALFAIIIGMASCSKDKTIATDNAPVSSQKKLTKAVHGTDTWLYEYTSAGKIKGYTYGGGVGRMEFDWKPNVLAQTVYINNIKKGDLVYELLNGICQKLKSAYYDDNGNITEENSTVYLYNAKGQLEKEEYSKNGTYYAYRLNTFNAGNELVKYVIADKNGMETRKVEFEYDEALVEKFGPVTQFYSGGTSEVFPKMTGHLIKKRTVTDNTGVNVYTNTFTTDAQGYVLTENTITAGNVLVESVIYTWQ